MEYELIRVPIRNMCYFVGLTGIRNLRTSANA